MGSTPRLIKSLHKMREHNIVKRADKYYQNPNIDSTHRMYKNSLRSFTSTHSIFERSTLQTSKNYFFSIRESFDKKNYQVEKNEKLKKTGEKYLCENYRRKRHSKNLLN